MWATGFLRAERATGAIGIQFALLLVFVTDIHNATAGALAFAVEEAEAIFVVPARRKSATAGCGIAACAFCVGMYLCQGLPR